MSGGLENGKNGAARRWMTDDSFPPKTAVSPFANPPARSFAGLTQACPHFGSPDDAATRFLFASPAGTCHRAEPPELVSLAHQQACCLTAQHAACPVFRQTAAGPLPADLRAGVVYGRTWTRKLAWAVGAVIVLALATAVSFLFWPGNTLLTRAGEPAAILAAVATATPTSAATKSVTLAPQIVASTAPPTVTPSRTPTATSAPTLTASATAVPSPTLPATFTPSAAASPPLPPTAVPLVIVNVPTLNVRQGPGIDYALIGAIAQGEEYEAVGQSFNGAWWQLCCVAGEPGWVIGEAVTVTGDTANVPVVSAAPAETGSEQ